MRKVLNKRLSEEVIQDIEGPDNLHPVVGHMIKRLKEGSVRGKRTDGRTIALAVEGGGFRGTVSGGMCLILESAGLIDAIDIIYGTSSGALNGAFTAAGQAALGSTNYEDVANRQFYNPFRLIGKRGVIDFDFLLNQIIRNRKPLDVTKFKSGPDFRAIAVNPKTQSVEILKDFNNVDEIMQAIRVSCALPYLTGPPSKFRGVPMIDGGILAPIPYKQALEEGATDVLVLRSRPEFSRKKKRTPDAARKAINRRQLKVISMLADSHRIYNEQAEELIELSNKHSSVYQIVPSGDMATIPTRERNVEKIRAAMMLGARSAAHSFGMPEIDLVWHPVPYITKRV